MKTIAIILFILVTACSTSKQSNTYKIQLGKKCTQDGNIYSYVWLHTVYGKQLVKKEYC